MGFSVDDWRDIDSVLQLWETRAEEGGKVEGHNIQKPVAGLGWTTTSWRLVDSVSAVVQHTSHIPVTCNTLHCVNLYRGLRESLLRPES